MFNKIILLAVKQGFIKKIVLPRLKIEQFKIGPTGLLLQENLKLEWFYNIVLHKDIIIFLNKGDVSESFNYAKAMCLEKLPFGIAEKLQNKKIVSTDDIIDYYKEKMNNESMNFADFFAHEDGKLMKCTVFTSPDNSTPFFHQWQRQRRMWWRKFSAQPGRYSLTDVKNGENNVQTVEILANYPWSSQVIETLVLNTSDKNYSAEQLQFKEGKKLLRAHSITSKINLSTMFLNVICDAFDESLSQEKKRELLRFHRKLAPYKISFAFTASSASSLSELNDLALYLSRQLKTQHISTLLLPSASKHTLETQYRQYDQLGVPYTVVLNENTLKNGIIYLRSRDTTLKEQVHVTDLVTYVEQLFKNY